MKKRALLSVSDKDGIVAFAKELATLGYEIISTGGTEKVLREKGLSVIPAEEVTGFPEAFGGRVKTLHPKILGGVLYRRSDAQHTKEAMTLGIEPIDLVVVNLYPFAETLKKIRSDSQYTSTPVASRQLIEQIDIGGPTLLRSAAKNHEDVTVICDPADYDRVMTELRKGKVSDELRLELAAKVFLHTAAYDALIAETLSQGASTGVMLTSGKALRYGENPHQWGKYYELGLEVRGLGTWRLLQGKELSYLNILDADAAWRMACEFDEPTAVFVKHANPSGIASHDNISEAFQRAYDTDRLSAFGVIIALNREVTTEIVRKIIDQKMFVEVIIAPAYAKDALALLAEKPNIRAIVMSPVHQSPVASTLYRSALGGMLVQNDDTKKVTESDLTCVTKKAPTKDQVTDLLFAWHVAKHAKSNAIVFAKNEVTVGIGCGQTSRVDATWIALRRAGEKAKGAVMASDAFFPFPDSLDVAAEGGIAAVIQPGGSVKDADVIKRADELGLAMVVTGVRGFRH
jgi:phosphoribosylaminoimidazolecarboxamide formyltransferase/IMP cyclohydrolase